MELLVYGESDDVIVVQEVLPDGRFNFIAEFAVRYGELNDEPNYLGFSDGTLLRISYDGFWHIIPLERGKSKIDHRSGTDIHEDYSDAVTLENVDGFAWIVEGKDMKRLAGELPFSWS